MERLLQEAIGTLDDDHRIVVVLRDVEDLSIEEICEITGLPDGYGEVAAAPRPPGAAQEACNAMCEVPWRPR